MSNGDYSTISSSKAKPKEKQIDEQQQKKKKEEIHVSLLMLCQRIKAAKSDVR